VNIQKEDIFINNAILGYVIGLATSYNQLVYASGTGFEDAGSKEKSKLTMSIQRCKFMKLAAPHSFTKWQALRFMSVVD
jgi:hypothetical protein